MRSVSEFIFAAGHKFLVFGNAFASGRVQKSVMIVENSRIQNGDADAASVERAVAGLRLGGKHAGRRVNMSERFYFLVERKVRRAAQIGDGFGDFQRQFDDEHIQIFRFGLNAHAVFRQQSASVFGF